MSCKYKQNIFSKVWGFATKKSKFVTQEQLISHLSLSSTKEKTNLSWQLHLPLKFYKETDLTIESIHFHMGDEAVESLANELDCSVQRAGKNSVEFHLDRNKLVRDVLDSDPVALNYQPLWKKLIVEFSSPNIAKPFHVGHLRSTIIGNFIGNLKKKLGKDVVKLNYLGDWGTQFGLIQLGLEMENHTDDDLKKNATSLLYEAYVRANKEADGNSDVHQKAREIFQKLEEKDAKYVKSWNTIKEYAIKELEATYKRLGVHFDEYNWESSYGKNEVQPVLEYLRDAGMLAEDEKARTVAVVEGRKLPLIKSDGSTLYLLRDIAAALDRSTRHAFDELYYVVENGQSDHLQCLFDICKNIGMNKAWNMNHVKFGRVHGMSTRAGKVVFLHDILDEARDIMFERQTEARSTKVEVTQDTAGVLGTTAVIINDLKQRRQRDYDFSWDKALQTTGDSGIRLQYAHSRLVSLLRNSGASPAKECDPEALLEPEVTNLVLEIARFEEVLLQANKELEACVVVVYLFQLCHAINKAIKVLPVKGSAPHVASQRLLLFNHSRLVLAEALRILGITPMDQM